MRRSEGAQTGLGDSPLQNRPEAGRETFKTDFVARHPISGTLRLVFAGTRIYEGDSSDERRKSGRGLRTKL